MEFNILSESKGEAEIEIGSLTLVELLRIYLNKDSSVEFAAWKREHPSRNPVLKIIAKDVRKSFNGAIESAIKDLDGVSSEFKSIK